ncbi:hypothetical protein HG535_0C00670 [Zygotorulaspora mrakii]|uniref:Oleate activated transcription factor 3 n=1 Tax=Zygotorulaspora mrakii TaxID=42260 RepID=A0A7H9AZ76_ZYGMR|nr:uncharacterized protein HG535_0C00670 [Zygotorulaspora mrakii]QLG71718.1 hypothetical protein HG535_0C00670 [Zygotorulaspora mrakii]
MSGQRIQPVQPIKRRKRLTIVCTNCKRRKSKCDRKQPCTNCIRLGDQDSCCYIQQHSATNENEEMTKKQKKGINIASRNKKKDRNDIISQPLIHDSQMNIVGPSTIINVIPNGFLISVKRSAATEYSLFTDVSMEHRDPYLKSLITFRHIAIGMTVKNLKANGVHLNRNSSLPQSFTPLSIFDADGDPLSSESAFRQLELIHKSLFDKFGSYRKYDALVYNDDDAFIAENLPPRNLFLDEILPYFETRILELIPIFDMPLLRHELKALYDTWEQKGQLCYKTFDHVVYSMVLLITKISQLSMNLSKLSAKIQFPLRDLNTGKYISIVNHFLFKMKSLRKCTLLQLQCLILLRFYYWCGPEDGDGAELQHSRILSGTIIASCKEMGINWNSILHPNEYYYEIHAASRPSSSVMNAKDYKRVYRMIWSYILFWDRKLCLISGQECVIGKSFPYDDINEDATWHEKVVVLDQILKSICEMLNNFPTSVDVTLLYERLATAKCCFSKIKTKLNKTLNFEYEVLLDVFELCLVHAEMVHYEYKSDAAKFAATFQNLWAHVVRFSQVFMAYFNDEGQKFDSFTRFYSNKVIVVAANKICVLVPAIILRLHRFSSVGFPEADVLVKFLFGFSSIYFTEFGFDYYSCFKKMFTAKITYKILNRPPDKNPWVMILEFLLHELKRELKGKVVDEKGVKNISLIAKLREAVNKVSRKERDILKIWNDEVFPIINNNEVKEFDLYVEQLEPFLVDLFSSSFNLFASFYDNASSKLVDGAEKAKCDTSQTLGNIPAPVTEDLGPMSTGEVSTTSSNPDNELANFELIQDLFEPFDFVSFF